MTPGYFVGFLLILGVCCFIAFFIGRDKGKKESEEKAKKEAGKP